MSEESIVGNSELIKFVKESAYAIAERDDVLSAIQIVLSQKEGLIVGFAINKDKDINKSDMLHSKFLLIMTYFMSSLSQDESITLIEAINKDAHLREILIGCRDLVNNLPENTNTL